MSLQPSNEVPIDRDYVRALAQLFGAGAIRFIEVGNARVAEFYAMRAGTYANILLDEQASCRSTGKPTRP